MAAGGTFQWKKGPGINSDAPAAPPTPSPLPTPPRGPSTPNLCGGHRCHLQLPLPPSPVVAMGTQVTARICSFAPKMGMVSPIPAVDPPPHPADAPIVHNGIIFLTRPPLCCSPPPILSPILGQFAASSPFPQELRALERQSGPRRDGSKSAQEFGWKE